MMDNSYNLALTGDSIITRRITSTGDQQTQKLFNIIREADVSFTNLEVLPNDFVGFPAARSDGAHLVGHSWVLDELIEMGFDLFSCANNHAVDYGTEGLLRAMEEMEKRQMTYAGVGKNLTEARMPAYFDHAKGSVALISCTSTFFVEQAAGEQRPDVQGRPGVNPLRYNIVYEVTKDHLESLRDIAEALGLEKQRQETIKTGFASEEKDPDIFPLVDNNLRAVGPLNAKFRVADKPAIRTMPNKEDLEDICKWIREAKARAEIVIVSLHAHEQGETREEPAEFIKTFCHRVIDEGADIVVGHGPHFLRGMEIYKGKPIFYSLGNLIGQNELIYKLPQDSYKRFGIDPSLTPSELFRIRSEGGKKGFPADRVFWETVMPICYFEDGQIRKIQIVPIALSHGTKSYHLGRPYLANAEEGEKILERFAQLSRSYGTSIENGFVVL